MGWRRLGLLFHPRSADPRLATHAALPTAVPIDDAIVRVFYSGRDAENRSSIGAMVFRVGDPPIVLEEAVHPVLTPGTLGMFDDAGVSVGSVVPHPEGDRLYYLGWNVGGSLRWRNAIGLAVGDIRTARFERHAAGPLMDRSPLDPLGLSYPWVLKLGPTDWRMWYGATLSWNLERDQGEHVLRHARSADGLDWTREQLPVLRPRKGEHGLARPSVIQDRAAFHMWFSGRGDADYTLGYAQSQDGLVWERRDDVAGLEPAAQGWEQGAVAYPCVFTASGRLWMLYNGARYGATGFGLAMWEGAWPDGRCLADRE